MGEIKVQVTPNKPQNLQVGTINVKNSVQVEQNPTYYYSTLAKQWAVKMDGLVQGEDYSSKYWANKSKNSAEIAEASIETNTNLTEILTQNYQTYINDLTNEHTQALSDITKQKDDVLTNIDSAKIDAISDIIDQENISKNNIIATGSEQINLIQNEGAAQIVNIQQTGFYMKDGKLYYTDENGDEQEFESGGGGLEVGDIGTALYIDETKGKRRRLNGSILAINANTQGFLNWLKNVALLVPSLITTEENWQAEVTLSKLGQCGKFVINEEDGHIRLPKVINIQGLSDLSKTGVRIEAGLPSLNLNVQNTGAHAHSRGTQDIKGTFGMRRQYTDSNILLSPSGAFSMTKASGYKTVNAQWTTTEEHDAITFQASKNWTGSTSSNGAHTHTITANSIYGSSSTVQEEAIQYPYFIQIATGAETEVDIVNEIELNNPFFFGMSQYFDNEPNNLSWLKSIGQWNNKADYPDYYNWILENVNNGAENFIGKTVYCFGSGTHSYRLATLNPIVGSIVYGVNRKYIVGRVTSVNNDGSIDVLDTIENVTYTNLARNSSNDISSSEYISDYDFVINTEDETFRLPLLNGSEDMPSNKSNDLELKPNGSTYIAPANGFVYLRKVSGAPSAYIIIKSNILSLEDRAINNTNILRGWLPVTKDENYIISYTASGETQDFKFIYAQGNGSLYFYVGETVQNANLIDAGRIAEDIVDLKVGKANVEDLDGIFVNTKQIIASKIAIATSSVTYSLAKYLPNDGNIYEVWVEGSLDTGATSGNYGNLYVGSDLISVMGICGARTRTNSGVTTKGSIVIPVGLGRYISVGGNDSPNATYSLVLHGYRKIRG